MRFSILHKKILKSLCNLLFLFLTIDKKFFVQTAQWQSASLVQFAQLQKSQIEMLHKNGAVLGVLFMQFDEKHLCTGLSMGKLHKFGKKLRLIFVQFAYWQNREGMV